MPFLWFFFVVKGNGMTQHLIGPEDHRSLQLALDSVGTTDYAYYAVEGFTAEEIDAAEYELTLLYDSGLLNELGGLVKEACLDFPEAVKLIMAHCRMEWLRREHPAIWRSLTTLEFRRNAEDMEQVRQTLDKQAA